MHPAEKVSNLGTFLKVVSDIRSEWQTGEPRSRLDPWDELWFRGEGHTHPETKLRPALYRPLEDQLPKTNEELVDIEDDLFERFGHYSTELARQESLDRDEDDSWGRYFLIQHYGGPTRLLDWSDGALIALHFAIRDDRRDNVDRYVYVLDSYWLMDHLRKMTLNHRSARGDWAKFCRKHPLRELDPEEWDRIYLPSGDDRRELPIPEFPLVLELDHFARRISAQRSRFIVFGRDSSFFETLLADGDSRLVTIPVDGRAVSDLRVQLRDAGVTESVIYPNLDGLGRELNQLWRERLRETTPSQRSKS